MSPIRPEAAGANRLLGTLSSHELERITPFLTERRLVNAEPVQPAWSPVTELFFPTGCILSVISETSEGRSVEVATVGNEGMIGASAFLGSSTSPLNVVCQVAGNALVGRTADLVPENGHSGLRTLALRYSDTMFIQASITAACNRVHPLEQRAARWLLTISDRIEGRSFGLTHEFFAVMLGSQRPSVSLAAQMLQRGGLITYRRGRVEILDHEGLAAAACDCYRTITEHYDKTMGVSLGETLAFDGGSRSS